MRARSTRYPALADELAGRIADGPATRVRVLVDGAPPTRADRLADQVAERLRPRGRPVLRVHAGDFPRPASVRLEHGRQDPDELLEGWLDAGGLAREVLDPAGPDGSGWVLPRLWDVRTDRAYRDERVQLASDAVLLVDGALLLGRGLAAELTVHLRMSPAALARRSDPDQHWTLAAYARYDAEHDPGSADLLVLADDPERPAVVVARQ